MSARWPKAVVGAMVVAMLATGCSREYGRISIIKLDGEPGSAASASGLRLTEGDVLVFEAHVHASGDRPYNGFERVRLRSSDDDVAWVRESVRVDRWVVGGMRPGTAEVLVEVDGVLEDSIDLRVEEVSP